MNNFTKLFAIFLVFIQIAFSQAIQSNPVSIAAQQLCKKTRYQALCISTLSLDPRSKTSSVQEFAGIAVDATTKKVKEMQQYLISVLRKIRLREDFERYGTCIEEYGAAIDRFLPAVVAALKAKKYSVAMSQMNEVVSKPGYCEDQFAGKSPLTGRNKAVHDIADMTTDIIKTISTN
ncbi:PREDICTED: pectinesterase inhibitor-like [Camelina sativa]|uniref:Pectinesterase inhibitor-like n=1 Tax=Camelina sativa TaxID=90675 RepID=A0ABM0WAS4_CAMSA|nr:PREDICTED: pectinesterase inhibitor-like [Camelina sativa]